MSYPVMSTSVPWSLVKSGFKKTPHFNTVVQKTAAGRGTSTFSLQPYATWDFEVDLSYVAGGEAVAGSVLQSFLSCYLQTSGGAGFFLFTDPNDSAVSLSQGIALNVTPGAASPMGQAGDGTSTQFQLARLIGLGVDILQNVSVTTLQVNGVTKALGTDYSISATGVLTFTVATAAAATIAWAGTFQYLCKFVEDTLKDLARVSKNSGGFLWECSAIQFEGEFV
jgi:hypothetical protein